MAARKTRRRSRGVTGRIHPVSPYELFYDLVFAGAILGLSIDFGRSDKWSAFWVAATTFTFAWWIWQETVLFTNRFGDPLGPVPASANRREAMTILLIRWVCLLQMVAVVLVALFEPAYLDPDELRGEFAWACAGALAALALLREIGARQMPKLEASVAKRRPWEIIAIAFFVADALTDKSTGPWLWLAALSFTVLPGLYLEVQERRSDTRAEKAHLSERLMLFVLIISGDIFLKIIVYWNTNQAFSVEPLQLIFVSSIIFSVFRLYISRVESVKPPSNSGQFVGWLLLHLVLSFSLLVAAGGMVQYVTPKETLTYFHLMSAGWGIALTVACIAALHRIGAGPGAGRAALNLLGIALLVGVGATAATYATPQDWRVGMATIAVILLVYTTNTSILQIRARPR